jgi:RNA polymerase primary sigma factor
MLDQHTADLITRCQDGDNSAYDQIEKENFGLISKAITSIGEDPIINDDLVQEGRVGMWIAVRKFDFSKKTKFSTYAYIWINSRVIRFNRASKSSLGYSDKAYYKAVNIYNFINNHLESHDNEPKLQEIAEEMECSPEDVQAYKRIHGKEVGLSYINTGPFEYVDGEDFITKDPMDVEQTVLDRVEADRKSNMILSIIEYFDERDKKIVCHSFGIMGYKKMDRESIAKKVGCSKTSVFNIKKRMVDEIRSYIDEAI